MKFYAISLMSFFAGYICFAILQRNANKAKQVNGVTLVRAFKTNPAYDSIYVYSDGHMVTTKFNPPYRYFMVAYKYRGKNTEIEGEGNYSFSSPRIPSNETLDSMILSGLPLKRNCYQGIIYQNFFEFKNGADWDDFYGNTPELKPVKNHTPCN